MRGSKPNTKTKTAGAIKGGEDKYHYRMNKVKRVPAGTGYSTANGGVVESRSATPGA